MRMICSVAVILAIATLLSISAEAAPMRTKNGRVNAAQIIDAVDRSAKDPAARELLAAYVSGVVESLIAANTAARVPIFCPKGSGGLDGKALKVLMLKAAPDAKLQASTEAAPVIVAEMIRRYPCSSR